MDSLLWMHNDVHAIRWNIEQAAGLDHLETLVHQGGRINGDSLSHLPGGMIECLLHGDRAKLRLRRVQKRAARGCQPDALVLVDLGVHATAAPALMNGD